MQLWMGIGQTENIAGVRVSYCQVSNYLKGDMRLSSYG